MFKKVLLLTLLSLMLFSLAVLGDTLIDNQVRYGLKLEFAGTTIPIEVSFDGPYIYEDGEDYIVTLLYEGKPLAKFDNNGVETIKTSFFNPPNGDNTKLSWLNNSDRIKSNDQMIQYRVNKIDFEKSEGITIFLYDMLDEHNNDNNISLYFNVDTIDFNKIPTIDQLTKGYDFESTSFKSDFTSEPADWAVEKIEELKSFGTFKATAFDQFNQGITRVRFVYLMVELYENLTGEKIVLNEDIFFSDTTDLYARKAAQIGITTGIGNNQFGPDIILSREQMATFVVKTLTLSGIDLETSPIGTEQFSDDDQISDWARDAIYTSKMNKIINGVGNNEFAPKLSATNEQSLVLMHSIMSRFANMNYYKEIDKNRVYVKYGENLYFIPFEKNLLVKIGSIDNSIYLKSFEDIDLLLSLAHSTENSLKYLPSSNPNINGILEKFSLGKMHLDLKNIYFGVDKIGEQTSITMTSNTTDKSFSASIKSNIRSNLNNYTGFDKVLYYDLTGMKQFVYSIPVENAFDVLGLKYSLEYNELWDIYIIEFIK